MIAVAAGVVALLVASADTSYSAAALRRLALTGSEAALVRAVGASPVTSRDALALVYARAAHEPDPSAELQAAHRLASAIARVTGDSFPLRQSAQFGRWSPGQRRSKVEIDSLRRAGNAAFSREGFSAALPLWRDSAQRGSSLPDTAGLAAALGAPFMEGAMMRSRATPPQTGLGHDERRRNAHGAFRLAEPGVWKERRVVLVDDVLTTGATLEAGLACLREAGARAAACVLAWAA